MNTDAPRFAMNSPAVAASPSSVGASSALSPTAASPLITAPFAASRQEDIGAAHVVPAESVLSFRGLQYLPIRACERVNKINKVGRNQDRILVVTTTHLYTALPADGDVQRCIAIAAISEVRVHKARLEMAVVMPAEYDLLMQCYDPASFLRLLAAISTAATTSKAVKVVELSGPINFQEYSLEKPNQFARAPLPVATTVYAQLVAAPRRRDEQVSGLGDAVRAVVNAGAPSNSHLSFEKAIRQADAESGADTPPLVGGSASADRGGTETPEPGWTAMAAVECGPLEEPAAAVGASAKPQLDAVGASQAAVLRKPMFEDFDSAETATLKRQAAGGVASPHSASSGRNDNDAAAGASTSSLLKGRMFGGGGGKRLDAAVPTGEASRQVPAASERVGRDAVSDVEAPLELFRLRTELAEARRDRDDMARGVAMLLRAKGEADAVMRAELDSLRLTIERLSAENLRLRRPWALDM
jgi:hypothetical protein